MPADMTGVTPTGVASRLTARDDGAIVGPGELVKNRGVIYCKDWIESSGGPTSSDCQLRPVTDSQRNSWFRHESDNDGEDLGRTIGLPKALRSKRGNEPARVLGAHPTNSWSGWKSASRLGEERMAMS